jgi:hypothetical protein
MPKNLLFLCFALVTLSSCEMLQVITAKNHKPEIQTPESIRHFAKKHGFEGYPILYFDTSIMSGDRDFMFGFNMYNKEGKCLSLDAQIAGCPDQQKEYAAMRYLLEDGDEHFIKDSVAIVEAILKDNKSPSDAKSRKDTSVWQLDTMMYSAHLDNYSSYFRTLEGEAVDVYDLYDKYIMLYPYQKAGYSKFHCILIREKIRQLEKLEKEFGPGIQLVLVNRDQLETNGLNISIK